MASPRNINTPMTTGSRWEPLSELTAPSRGPISNDLPGSISSERGDTNDVRDHRPAEEHQLLQRKMLQWMGRPYLLQLCTITIVIKISALLGNFSFVVLWSNHLTWKHFWDPSATTSDDQLAALPRHDHLWMCFSLILGGFLSGLCLWCLPFSSGKIRHLYHSLTDLDPSKVSYGDSLAMALASWVLLLCGAPFGPELALGALASLLVSLISNRSWIPGSHQPRAQACWMQASMAAALAAMFPTPVSSALVIQELVLTARPNDISLDDVVALKNSSSSSLQVRAAQFQTRRQPSSGDYESDEALDSDEDAAAGLDVPLISSPSPYYHNATNQRKINPLDQDFMEMTFMSGTAATVAFLIYQTLSQFAHVDAFGWSDYKGVLGSPTGTIDHRHYLLAVPMGLLGGLVGTVILVASGTCHWVRSRTCRWLDRSSLVVVPSWFGPMIFSTIAGLVVAGLTFLVPQPWMVLDNGSHLMLYLLQKHDNMTMRELLAIAGSQIGSLAVATGFGWFVGPLLPLAGMGVCTGLIVSTLFPSLTISLTVPCCMAAVVGSIIPVPFTIVLTLLHLFALQAELAGPIFLATVVAQSVTGGLGFLRWFGKRVIGPPIGRASDMEEEEHRQAQEQLYPSDDEILQSVRSAIFGSGP